MTISKRELADQQARIDATRQTTQPADSPAAQPVGKPGHISRYMSIPPMYYKQAIHIKTQNAGMYKNWQAVIRQAIRQGLHNITLQEQTQIMAK